MRASSEHQFGALRKVLRHARCSSTVVESLVALYRGGYAPDSTKAEGSPIVDDPREC